MTARIIFCNPNMLYNSNIFFVLLLMVNCTWHMSPDINDKAFKRI